MKTFRQNKGITLIALVVTIIILLILAGIALNLTIGENGIFSRAQIAASTWRNAEANEQNAMDNSSQLIDFASEFNNATTVEYAKLLNKPFENNTTIKDDLNNKVTIPAGFKISTDSATKVEDGIVVEDKDGNQFVWIPAKTGEGATINLENGNTTSIKYQREDFKKQFGDYDNYYEDLASDEETSVNKYGGYYIGRYETGDKESTENKILRQSGFSNSNTVTIKKDQSPYNWINKNDAVLLAESMDSKQSYNGTTKLVSSYAWDTAINFIEIKNDDYAISSEEGNYFDTTFNCKDLSNNFSTKNQYQGSLVLTGQTSSVSNIYDMGGNMWEYSSENYIDNENVNVSRGGDYFNNYSFYPSGQRYNNNGGADIGSGFRIALYIN